MSLIDSEISKALGGRVKRKRNNTKQIASKNNAKQKAGRIAGNSPEVMVKITGFAKGSAHVRAHLAYISRNAKVEIEDEKGNVLSDKESVNKLFNKWEKDFAKDEGRKNRRDTMNMVLSMPEGTPSEDVRSAVREFAKKNFGKNHEYVMALHSPENDQKTKQPHVHISVKVLGFDGKRLDPRKDNLQAWREDFAENLRRLGVDAEASPRTARGVIKKAEKNVIRHIEKGDETHAPRVPKVKAALIKEIAEEINAEQQGKSLPPKPWIAAIEAKQEIIKQSWLKAATYLEQRKPTVKFNNKELPNERPDYRNTESRQRTRVVTVHQSNIEKTWRRVLRRAESSLRNLPRLNVVQEQSTAKVLLQQNAPNRLGGGRGAADHEMRRARAGNNGNAGSRERLDEGLSIVEQQKSLAERIRGFVAAMPAVETQAQKVKNDLMQRFGKSKDKDLSQSAKLPSADKEQKNGVTEITPRGKDKGNER